MSKKILVTTDLSVSSKAGIRFAIQLAKQAGFSIIYYNAMEIDQPTRWSDTQFNTYVKDEIIKGVQALDKFVRGIYKDEGVKPGKYQLVVEEVESTQEGIINYGIASKADFICMSTRGAGKISRILGTNASYIIKHSPIPVLAIPKNYRTTRIDHILYASDLNGLTAELNKVKKFADSVRSKLTVLHYDYLSHVAEVRDKFQKTVNRQSKPGIKFYLEKFDIENSLSAHLQKAARKFNPSVVVLFTKQDRDWFDRLFLSSKSAEVSFESKKPLLIYSKKG